MYLIVQKNTLRQSSPLRERPVPLASTPNVPIQEDMVESTSNAAEPKWLLAAFAGLSLLACSSGVTQAQVVVKNQPQQFQELMKQLEESSLQQGIKLDFMLPSPVGGGRSISSEDAGKVIADGQSVLLAEVTSVDGPFRGGDPVEVRREVSLTGLEELASYTRYFTNAQPENDLERAAQKLKHHLFLQEDLTVLLKPGANPERPGLSPFAAARRLQSGDSVTLRTEADGVIRTQAREVELSHFRDLAALDQDCSVIQNFRTNPDGTIQLVEQLDCQE